MAVLLIGALLLVFGPNVYASASTALGVNGQAGAVLFNIALTLVSSLTFPLGAALIAAAIVIQTLAPGRDLQTVERHGAEG